MMLPGTRRATGSNLCDMNFLNLVELASTVFGEQAGEARHESGANNHRQITKASFLIKGE
jgi:hypothetical protein